MALLMATWSPAWCQCVLLTAAQAPAPARLEVAAAHACCSTHTSAAPAANCQTAPACDDGFCTGEGGGQTPAPFTAMAPPDMALTATTALAAACCPGQREHNPNSGDPCSCACCDQVLVTSLPQPITLTLAAAPLAAALDLSAVVRISLTLSPPATGWGYGWRHGPPTATAPSLLAQRCLMLI